MGDDAAASRWRAYRDVDAVTAPELLSRQLEDIASVQALAETKRHSVDLLSLNPGEAVLDVGCGTGVDLPSLARVVGQRGRIVGLDPSRHLLEEAMRKGYRDPPYELVQGDAHSLPFESDVFAGCRCDRTLQHLERPDVAIAEMSRVTRPGGRIVISETRASFSAPGIDQDVSSEVVGFNQSDSERGNWIGLLIPMMCQLAGLTGVGVVEDRFRLDTFDEAFRYLNLAWALETAVATGRVEEMRADAWRDGLAQAFVAGEAQVECLALHVVAEAS